MSKIRRAGYLFLTWKGDHEPRHVHVYYRRSLLVKWDLELGRPISGRASRRVRRVIAQLVAEGRL
jgi:hypothetical protein